MIEKKKVKGKFVIKLKNMITKSSTNYNDKLQLDCESKYLGGKNQTIYFYFSKFITFSIKIRILSIHKLYIYISEAKQ